LGDFASIADLFSAREIDGLQAAIDARRDARSGRAEDTAAAADVRAGAARPASYLRLTNTSR
jgi:hypothetical protein